jgi:hypothetical protein
MLSVSLPELAGISVFWLCRPMSHSSIREEELTSGKFGLESWQ